MLMCRNGVRSPATAHLELILARNVNDSKNNFYRYIGSKRKRRENVSPQLSRARDLVTKDTGESEVLGTFTSAFPAKVCLQESWASDLSKNDLLLVGKVGRRKRLGIF